MSWKDHWQTAELIMIKSPQSNKKQLFGDELLIPMEKVRKFPLSTKRPTFSELERCFEVLTTVEIVDSIEGYISNSFLI